MLYVAIWYVSIRPVFMRVDEERLSSFALITSSVNILMLCDAVLFCRPSSMFWKNLQPLFSV